MRRLSRKLADHARMHERHGRNRAVRGAVLRRALFFGSLALIAAPGLACPPPPPPPAQNEGESTDAYYQRLAAINAEGLRRYDARMLAAQLGDWERASQVAIARVTRSVVVMGGPYGGMRRVDLEPVSTLKGSPIKRSFRIADTGMTDCGAYGGGDATTAKVGDKVIVYFGPGRPGQKTMIDAVGAERLRDPRLLAALTPSN
jgi:hypothetical protein